ncbi:MAG: phosphatidate cytidylyltransferase [Ectothiorhodospiraceae bacterium]|nr:phosphatidate cytidylyltransferase [Chromatiales bacterium]MCP5156916.1 phosphatidate cytidylyltransferase [Ectothiorhodospiraceae bacterium]
MAMDSELRRRVATAAVLVPLVVAGVLWAPSPLFATLAAALVLGGAWEWCRMMGWSSGAARVLFLGTTAVLLALATRVDPTWVLLAGVGWWLLAIAWVVRFEQGSAPLAAAGGVVDTLVRATVGWVILVPAWLGLVLVQHASPALALLLLVVVWGADCGAYFAGRAFGRNRLAPRTSPGKTIEGVAGGVVLAVVIGTLVPGSVGWQHALAPAWVALLVVVVLVSVLGDLAESMFKRLAGIKDSGTLLPGHGGVLDRIDSLTSAVPCFALGLLLTGLA